MISPAYTPFSEQEVRYTLGLSRRAYLGAVSMGTLARSVHFDCRYSPTTALHSLVDVVRFDVIFGTASDQAVTAGFAKQFDEWLEELCSLDEDCDDLGATAIAGDTKAIMRLVLPEDAVPSAHDSPANWHVELIILSRVIDSWCRCYRALHDLLVADEIRNHAPSATSRRHTRFDPMLLAS